MKKVLLLLFAIATTTIIAQTTTPVFKMDQITITSSNVKQMADFYSNVLGIQFSKVDAYGTSTYNGYMGDIKLFLCPSQLSPNTINQNRHQFDFVVGNISPIITNALKNGGKLKGDVVITQKLKSAVVLDPDGNSIVFKQILASEPIGKM
jgi:predicted enzyme related to lactoylglutathione lyase